jgi:serine/threonine protein kinase
MEPGRVEQLIRPSSHKSLCGIAGAMAKTVVNREQWAGGSMGIQDSLRKQKLEKACVFCGAENCRCQNSLDEAAPTLKVKTCNWCKQNVCVCPGIDRKSELDTAQDPLVGQIIGQHYEVLQVIGRGGMGRVYKVRHRNLKTYYALKMLYRKQGITKRAIKRFELEAKAASGLAHPNLVTVFDYGSAAQGPYIVMQLAEGRPLSDYIQLQQLLSEDRALDVFIQLCDALIHAHSRRVLHRDIKPGNIMIDESSGKPLAKLIDFGVAKVLTEEGETSGGITQTGEVVGSPKYMSPEQCLGSKQDNRSDLYSLGCVMFEALTGRSPFDGENAVQIYFSQINDAPPPFKDVCTTPIRAEIENVVLQCLEKSPELRYQRVEDLRADLLLLKQGKNPKVKSISAYRRRVRTSVHVSLYIAAIAATIALSALGYQWLRDASAPKWQRQIAQAEALMVRGRDFYPEAEMLYKQALDSAITTKASTIELEQIHLSLAHLYNESGWADAAQREIKDALVLSDSQNQDLQRGSLYDELANSYAAQKDWQKAIDPAEKAIDIKARQLGDSDSTEYSASKLALFLRKLHRLDESEKAYKADILLCIKFDPSQKSIALANAYRGLAQVLVAKAGVIKEGDIEFNVHRALNIYIERLGKGHPYSQHLASWFANWLRTNHNNADADIILEKVGLPATTPTEPQAASDDLD